MKIGKRPLRRGLLTMNPFQSTTEWALVANEEEKIHGPCRLIVEKLNRND